MTHKHENDLTYKIFSDFFQKANLQLAIVEVKN